MAAGEGAACNSHGIYRIEGLLRSRQPGDVVRDDEPQAVWDGSDILRVDARSGPAPLAFRTGLPHLIERGRSLGLAAMLINDCTHCSALWPEA